MAGDCDRCNNNPPSGPVDLKAAKLLLGLDWLRPCTLGRLRVVLGGRGAEGGLGWRGVVTDPSGDKMDDRLSPSTSLAKLLLVSVCETVIRLFPLLMGWTR